MTMHDKDLKRSSQIGPMMIAIAQSWRRAISQALTCEGLSDATALPLSVLYRRGEGMRQNELADSLGLEGTSVVRVLDSLERGGYVRREEDKDDRRAKQILLTDDGRALAIRTEQVFAELRSELLQTATLEDIEATERLLHLISAALTARLSKRRQ
ncbi:hypothetical protein A8A54_19185 [Brucella pseudogrignonensis]|uniref:MarR family winged helix-turn-helix transcriptional regulator n=1 Tax=Brucella pseudogrignonensis TaxID=419475 RepID=UPI0007DAA58E|nr:MarR family transcriptional regulator [Brucella pseudogrignonensis]ANG98732.1 hypothetical protein A8A54_19185 [Brucella pseudogrignonensis]